VPRGSDGSRVLACLRGVCRDCGGCSGFAGARHCEQSLPLGRSVSGAGGGGRAAAPHPLEMLTHSTSVPMHNANVSLTNCALVTSAPYRRACSAWCCFMALLLGAASRGARTQQRSSGGWCRAVRSRRPGVRGSCRGRGLWSVVTAADVVAPRHSKSETGFGTAHPARCDGGGTRVIGLCWVVGGVWCVCESANWRYTHSAVPQTGPTAHTSSLDHSSDPPSNDVQQLSHRLLVVCRGGPLNSCAGVSTLLAGRAAPAQATLAASDAVC
jgi:hypothetical protein